MKIPENYKSISRFFIPAVIDAALTGCATSRQQPSDANLAANAAASPAAQPTAQAARAKPAPTRRAPSAEASSKSSSAAILAQIHEADLKEIAIGKMADEKASTREVRDSADQLVKDHTTVDQMVVATAQATNVRLHDATAPRETRHQRAHTSMAEGTLQAASAAKFDRLFLQQTAADHDRLILALKQEREDASDDEIETLIDKVLPILEQHKELAQMLLKKEQA
jgi:putative membrane protein